jgi:hypothetical protein
MSQCTWIEGSHSFNVLLGIVTATVCFAVAFPMLWWMLARHRVFYFGSSTDRNQLLQLAYGVFCLSMAFADVLWAVIPHATLLWIHPALFLTTVLIGLGLGPRVAILIGTEFRRKNRSRSRPSAAERGTVLGRKW